MNTKDFLIGTLIGGIVGATTALFLAPKSGKELRSDISDQAHLAKEKTAQLTNDVYEKGNEWVDIAKEKSTTLAKNVSDQSQQVVDKVKDLSATAKKRSGRSSKRSTESCKRIKRRCARCW